jgi:TM2 domain-containing membrane protein YozV
MTTRILRKPVLLATALLLAAGAASAGTLEITGPAGVAVTVNGRQVGILPLDGPVETQVGGYRIEASHPGYVDFEQTVQFFAEQDVHRVTVRLLPLSRRTAWTSSILYAGLGQFYLGHRTRGWIYAGAETAGLLTALVGELQRSNHRSDFNAIQAEYEATFNGDRARELRAELEQTHDDMEKAEDLRNTGLLVAVAAIGISAVDAWLSFPDVEAGPGLVPLQTGWRDDPRPAPAFAAVHAGVRMEF